jgi:triphosphoribosyl-dephospho-CoA synthase
MADFPDTKYEHFLASAVAVTPYFELAAERGILISKKEITFNQIEIGEIIKGAVENVNRWQHGRNTLLGTIILLSPIAVAAGIISNEKFSIIKLRKKLEAVVRSTTPSDAVAIYEAIEIAQPGGLGESPKLDINDPESKNKILKDNITLFDVFKIASNYDSIAYEWVNNYPITFEIGYSYFLKQLKKTSDINVATVHTFLKVLSEIPDTLITRKSGQAISKLVSERAKQILEMGGLNTQSGINELYAFDEKLRKPCAKMNPGTTADIISAILAVTILNGYRP